MRLVAVLLTLAVALAGCSAKGEDPLAYTKKPLYGGVFDLGELGNGTDQQQFRVQDGSIGMIKVNVWINATAGGARVNVYDPSGRMVLTTTETTERAFPLNLGQWRVEVLGMPDETGASAGHANIIVTR